MIQPNLFSSPKARRTDPQTSWDAARSVDAINETQKWVLGALRDGDLTDEQIWDAYIFDREFLVSVSPSGLRTRRKELVEKGLIEDSGETGLTRSGRKTIKWRLA